MNILQLNILKTFSHKDLIVYILDKGWYISDVFQNNTIQLTASSDDRYSVVLPTHPDAECFYVLMNGALNMIALFYKMDIEEVVEEIVPSNDIKHAYLRAFVESCESRHPPIGIDDPLVQDILTRTRNRKLRSERGA